MRKPFIQIVDKLDDSNFKVIGKGMNTQRKLETLYKNIWSMFDLTGAKNKDCERVRDAFIDALDSDKPVKFSVNDFAWTSEVRDEFYKHPANKHAPKDLGLFILDSEPCVVEGTYRMANNQDKP